MFGRRPYRELERALGYRFRRVELVEAALTHPSYRHETRGVTTDNQRLEFLGDAVLSLLASAWLYAKYPNLSEGELTQRRARLTRSTTLAAVARQLDLGRQLRLGRGEAMAGGRERAKILEDAAEALIGAVFLDGGIKAAQHVFERCVLPCLPIALDSTHWDNPKGALLEWSHQQGLPSPQYHVVDARGPMHAREFVVEVCINGEPRGRGTGPSKKSAEHEAALAALRALPRQLPRRPSDR
ncbi:MAG: ribonuclease III [Kiritimatiellae bacterium]|nr:ribonuclease III [Kiritimatiellia bacterium]